MLSLSVKISLTSLAHTISMKTERIVHFLIIIHKSIRLFLDLIHSFYKALNDVIFGELFFLYAYLII